MGTHGLLANRPLSSPYENERPNAQYARPSWTGGGRRTHIGMPPEIWGFSSHRLTARFQGDASIEDAAQDGLSDERLGSRRNKLDGYAAGDVQSKGPSNGNKRNAFFQSRVKSGRRRGVRTASSLRSGARISHGGPSRTGS